MKSSGEGVNMASPKFKPAPNQTLDLLGEALVFQQHPGAAISIPHSQEGGRGTVYAVRAASGRQLALKVFHPPFRDPALADSGSRLAPLQNLEGLTAADRRVVLPGDAIVRRFPELEYALLMPWVEGETWAEVMLRIRNENIALPQPSAIHLCARFLKVVRSLEQAGISHTDISAGNVVVRVGPPAIQLLDLEDMSLPGSPVPPKQRAGAPGYRHPANESVFCPEGDRYAAAVLAAEILVLVRREFVVLATDTGVFGGNVHEFDAAERYDAVKGWLGQVAPRFAEAFARAWFSPTLRDCPTIAELHNAVDEMTRYMPVDVAPPPTNSRVTWSNTDPAPQPPAPPQKKVAAANPLTASKHVRWSTGPSTPPSSNEKSPAKRATRSPVRSGEIPIAAIVVLLVILIGLLVAVIGCAPVVPPREAGVTIAVALRPLVDQSVAGEFTTRRTRGPAVAARESRQRYTRGRP
jgi:serine/threonine protein kinase